MRIPNLAFASLLILLPLPMMADTYTYTGLDFTFVRLNPGAYTTSDSITGAFTMTGSLGTNQALEDAPFLTFSISDGVETFTNRNPIDDGFKVATDANGTIDQWVISLAIALPDQSFPDLGNQPPNTIFDMQNSSFTEPAGEDREIIFVPQPDGTLGNAVMESNFEAGSWVPFLTEPRAVQGAAEQVVRETVEPQSIPNPPTLSCSAPDFRGWLGLRPVASLTADSRGLHGCG
jgi:hypothetical protein